MVISEPEFTELKLKLSNANIPFYIFYEIIGKERITALEEATAKYIESNGPQHALVLTFTTEVKSIFNAVENIRNMLYTKSKDGINQIISSLTSYNLNRISRTNVQSEAKYFAGGLRGKLQSCYTQVSKEMFNDEDRPIIDFIEVVINELGQRMPEKINMVLDTLKKLNPMLPGIQSRINTGLEKSIGDCIRDKLTLA